MEPPLLQIGPRHKVACHFAGELGAHPATPVTTKVLAVDDQGSPAAGSSPMSEITTGPGFEDRWFDLKTQQLTGAK